MNEFLSDSGHTLPSRRLLMVLSALLVASILGGCSLQQMAVNQTADVLWEGRIALESERDPDFAREAFPASLKTIETFRASAQDNDKLTYMLAEGYFSYAFAFIELDLMRANHEGASEAELERLQRRAVIHYLKSHRYGLVLLDNDEFARAAQDLNLKRVQALLKKMDKDDVPGLFWTAYGWGSAANLSQDNTDMVAALPIVEAIMNRVIELDAGYFNGGAHLFFGVYYGSRPPMFGGDPEAADEHFQQAARLHGDKNLLIPVLRARFYTTAPGIQDRQLFEDLLNGALEADVEQYRRMRLNNEIARQRARFWLSRADELFY